MDLKSGAEPCKIFCPRKGRRRRRKSQAGRGTMEKEKPPVFGMMERGGQVVMHLLANVKQKTIEPFIKDTIESGTLVYTSSSPKYFFPKFLCINRLEEKLSFF